MPSRLRKRSMRPSKSSGRETMTQGTITTGRQPTTCFASALDERGTPLAWLHRIVAPSISVQHGRPLKDGIDSLMTEGAANLPYAIPNLQVEYIYKDLGIPVGFWRSVGASQNAFITESFIDELAAAAKKDPFEFRRDLLTKAARHKGVLELAAEKGDWGKPLPQGHFRGIAVAFSYGSYAAEVAEVSIEKDGKLRVHRVVCALDCGTSSIPTRSKLRSKAASSGV